VDLSKAFVGNHPVSDDDSRIVDLLEKAGKEGLKIIDRCFETETESSGIGLRRLIVAALAQKSEDRLILNFDGVTKTTRTFINGVFSGLIRQFGIERCKRQIGLQNIGDDQLAI
jgi:hypothetical protein